MFIGTSSDIHNHLIQAVSNVVLNTIKQEINDAKFVAIILHETSDVAAKSQMSTVLRFVRNGSVFERFMGFSDVSGDRTAEGLLKHVVNILAEHKIES